MSSRNFNSLLTGQNQPYNRQTAQIPGMTMPQFPNPGPTGRFIFPVRPPAIQPGQPAPITPAPGMPMPPLIPQDVGGGGSTPSGGSTGGDSVPGEGGDNW